MKSITRRRLIWGLPLGATVLAGGGFATMLSSLKNGKFDPHKIELPNLNKPIPNFKLKPILSYKNFDSLLLKQQHKPVLINFFASWCLPCISEMPILNQLSTRLSIWGIAYKDKNNTIDQFLNRHENPYQYLGQDDEGIIGINWGISGVPESFLIIPGGIIRWHYAKPLDKTAVSSLLSLVGT